MRAAGMMTMGWRDAARDGLRLSLRRAYLKLWAFAPRHHFLPERYIICTVSGCPGSDAGGKGDLLPLAGHCLSLGVSLLGVGARCICGNARSNILTFKLPTMTMGLKPE